MYNGYGMQYPNQYGGQMFGQYQGFQSNQSIQQKEETIWVQNEQAASAYLVAPNGFVRLWDASTNVFYEKRADANGRPLPMEAYTYTKRTEASPNTSACCHTDNEVLERIKDLEARLKAVERRDFINVSKSIADDTAVSAVLSGVQGQPTGGSTEAFGIGQGDTVPVE